MRDVNRLDRGAGCGQRLALRFGGADRTGRLDHQEVGGAEEGGDRAHRGEDMVEVCRAGCWLGVHVSEPNDADPGVSLIAGGLPLARRRT